MVNTLFGSFDRPEYEEDREPLNTKEMLMDGIWEGLKKSKNKVSREANNIDDSQEQTYVNVPTEKVLLDIYAVRDGLIECFGNTDSSSRLANDLTEHINRLGTCIQKLGGDSEEFNPLDHTSGLQAPNLSKTADKVVGLTEQCYSIGKVDSFNVSEDGKTIQLSFTGTSKGTNYKADGVIMAQNGWAGNEAIDYVYTTGAGKMSVKAFENGRWIDKCSEKSSSYEVSWGLNEWPEGTEFPNEDVPENAPEIKVSEIIVTEESQENLNEEGVEFTITEK